VFAGFDFVATEALFCFGLDGDNAFYWAELLKLHFVRSVHGIFGRVIVALPAGLADHTNNFSLIAFFSHNLLRIVTDKPLLSNKKTKSRSRKLEAGLIGVCAQ